MLASGDFHSELLRLRAWLRRYEGIGTFAGCEVGCLTEKTRLLPSRRGGQISARKTGSL